MNHIFSTDYLKLENFLALTGILFVAIFLRYVLFAGIGHYWLRRFFRDRELHSLEQVATQARKEMVWSAITSLIFAVFGAVLVILWQNGWTKLYTDLSAFPLWYLPLSLVLYLFLHETYYYWLHRWMHRPKVYRLVHKVHHDSTETNAHTAFSFHPLESVLQALIIPVLLLFIPLHVYLLVALLAIMTVSGTLNHLGYEIFPKGWARHPLAKWLIGATHHDQHHKRFRFNYGLYFTFWDRWMGTEHPEFEQYFDQVTDAKKAQQGR